MMDYYKVTIRADSHRSDEDEEKQSAVMGFVDSGAHITIIDRALARSLQLPIEFGFQKIINFYGESIEAQTANIIVKIPEISEGIRVRAAIVDRADEQFLGAELLIDNKIIQFAKKHGVSMV